MNTANMGYLFYFTTLIILLNVNATSSPIPLLDADNNATNNTKTSRLFDNNHGTIFHFQVFQKSLYHFIISVNIGSDGLFLK
jgi:hypothetical protein